MSNPPSSSRPVPPRLRGLLRGAAARLPEGLPTRAARMLRRGATVSVVATVTDANATFLPELLGSLGAQSRRADEVLLVVLGTTAPTLEAVDREVAGSWRVRRSDLPGADPLTGLAHGAGLAAGDRLLLVDAGDRLAPRALETLSAALDTGAELAGADLGTVGRADLADLMVTRALWERVGRPTVEADAPFALWWTAARLVTAAAPRHAPVPLPAGVREGERRGTGDAFGSMPVRAPWVPAWTAAVEDVLGRIGDGSERAAAVAGLLGDQAQPYLADAERCTGQEWAALAAAVRRWRDLVPAIRDVPGVEARVRVLLAAGDRRADLESFNLARWADGGALSTRVADGRVHAVLPVDVDPAALVLPEAETPLTAAVRRLRWTGDGEVEVEVVAHLRHVASDGGTATLHLLGPGGACTDVRAARQRDPEVDLALADRHADHAEASFRARFDVAALLRGAAAGDGWRLEVTLDLGGVVRRGPVTSVDQRGSAGAFPARGFDGLTLAARPGLPDGRLLVATDTPPPAVPALGVEDVRLDGDELVVRLRGPVTGPLTLGLDGPRAPAPVPARPVDGGAEARLPLRFDPWGLGERPLPPGGYRVRVGGTSGPVRLDAGLAARLPETQSSPTYRMRLQRALADGGALLTLGPPLADDEVGPAAQQRLQRWYATDEHRLDPTAVYLQSYTGQAATDTPLALHHELRRTRPDLRLRWAVADSSVLVPEGAERLLLRSREWYDALATSAHVVTNIDMERWFVRRPGQRLLQSFHGYPSKAMGLSAWEAKGFTPLRLDAQLRRTSGTWDLLLTPDPAMDVHYREQYRYDGEILAAGYPRDDVLVGPDAPRLRAEARARLGLADGQRAVLYAPTWRDDLATNFRAATMSTAFDVERAADALGPDYVILLRGHRFHRRRDGLAGAARLLDVTDYPEINDLVLACDVAVLDYSSLRFDVALTGRPMVFLVPDLDRYAGGRGFLYDFASSAPGPLVATTDEVVDLLRDLDGLAGESAAALTAFNDRFNSLQDGHAAERVVRAFFGPDPTLRG
ncbi:MAG: CDP-glycerol glycerophosphotransferase family protein [Nocardioides sp.]